MTITNNEIYALLKEQRKSLTDLIEPYWYRYERYKLPFCLFIIYSDSVDEEYFISHIRKTDMFVRLAPNLSAIAFEALDIYKAITIIQKLLYHTEDVFVKSNVHYYSSIVCESNAKEQMEELINNSFMILEYALEYNISNEVLNFGVIPTQYYS